MKIKEQDTELKQDIIDQYIKGNTIIWRSKSIKTEEYLDLLNKEDEVVKISFGIMIFGIIATSFDKSYILATIFFIWGAIPFFLTLLKKVKRNKKEQFDEFIIAQNVVILVIWKNWNLFINPIPIEDIKKVRAEIISESEGVGRIYLIQNNQSERAVKSVDFLKHKILPHPTLECIKSLEDVVKIIEELKNSS